MEDISRELEREIARAKPTPYKTKRKKKVLVVDDFGRMRSGTYLKVMVRFLALTSLIFGLAAGGFFFLYNRLSEENIQMKAELVNLEGRTKQLTDEKEILMARLVMAGKKPVLPAEKASEDSTAAAGKKAEAPEGTKAGPEADGKSPVSAAGSEKATEPDGLKTAAEDLPEDQGEAIGTPEPGQEDQGQAEETLAGGEETGASGVVSIEKFSVSEIPDRGELRIRFNIRNTKKGPGEISGRIFLLLKPASGTENAWIVIPKATIKDGVPSDYKRGQYFSISRFKPVQFTISRPSNFKDLTTAAVYIFGEDGQVVYRDVMEISLDEGN